MKTQPPATCGTCWSCDFNVAPQEGDIRTYDTKSQIKLEQGKVEVSIPKTNKTHYYKIIRNKDDQVTVLNRKQTV